MSTQTNDDNLDVETQTEEIESSNKWTQFPITCRKNLNSNEDIRMFKKVSTMFPIKNKIFLCILFVSNIFKVSLLGTNRSWK